MEHEIAFVVEGWLLTDVGGTLGVHVLSTPAMIAMMERGASQMAGEALDASHTTVGFEVCIRHVAGAAEGTPCVAHAVLREVVDERKLRFDVQVRTATDPPRVIGLGTHERRIVAVAGHASRLAGP